MPLSIEQAQNVSNLRLRMLENLKAGKESHEGIDREELKKALETIRKTRTVGTSSGTSKGSKPIVQLDLTEFMKK